MIGSMDGDLPLPALWSCALVAFTIEFDNEFEHRMPHRTTRHGATAPGGLWLVSLVMWSNCLRFTGDEGVGERELLRLAGTPTNLPGMRRWGYIVQESRSPGGRSDSLIRATAAGRQARQILGALFEIIEKRWAGRFGEDGVGRLREALWNVVSRMGVELPDCLPILGYGLFSNKVEPQGRRTTDGSAGASGISLAALLSKVLLAFAIEFERESEVSLAICANVLRLTGERGVRVSDLPRLSAVSKEAIAMALGFLQKRGYAVVQPESPGSRLRAVTLTAKGRRAREAYQELVWAIEERWRERFGKATIQNLRDALAQLVGDSTADRSPLFRGLEPYPAGWRASIPKPTGLPHYPMVLHRGGFPDGS